MFILFVMPISSPCETIYLEMDIWSLSLLKTDMILQMWWANTWRRHYLTWYTTFTPGSVSVMRFMASVRGSPYSVDTRERSWLPSYRCKIVIFLCMICNQKTSLAILTTQLASLSFGVLSSHLCIWFNTVWADNGLEWAGRIPISLKLKGKSEHW